MNNVKFFPLQLCRTLLEKRPTFEALDKRKSWSVVDTSLIPGNINAPYQSTASSTRSQNHINKRSVVV